MRKLLVGIIILLIGLSLLTLGIIEEQHLSINSIYEQMAAIP